MKCVGVAGEGKRVGREGKQQMAFPSSPSQHRIKFLKLILAEYPIPNEKSLCFAQRTESVQYLVWNREAILAVAFFVQIPESTLHKRNGYMVLDFFLSKHTFLFSRWYIKMLFLCDCKWVFLNDPFIFLTILMAGLGPDMVWIDMQTAYFLAHFFNMNNI